MLKIQMLCECIMSIFFFLPIQTRDRQAVDEEWTFHLAVVVVVVAVEAD